jgi:hypothetical protein
MKACCHPDRGTEVLKYALFHPVIPFLGIDCEDWAKAQRYMYHLS